MVYYFIFTHGHIWLNSASVKLTITQTRKNKRLDYSSFTISINPDQTSLQMTAFPNIHSHFLYETTLCANGKDAVMQIKDPHHLQSNLSLPTIPRDLLASATCRCNPSNPLPIMQCIIESTPGQSSPIMRHNIISIYQL